MAVYNSLKKSVYRTLVEAADSLNYWQRATISIHHLHVHTFTYDSPIIWLVALKIRKRWVYITSY